MSELEDTLLNLQNIPSNMISGMSGDDLQWVSHESSERYISELSRSFQQDLENWYAEEIPALDSDISDILRNAEKESIPRSTAKQTMSHIKKFKSFLQSHNLSTHIENIPDKYLNDYLSFFFYNLRTNEGKLYSPSSLICFRASIQRYLSGPEVNRKINIINDQTFSRSNRILKLQVGKWLKENGTENRRQYEAIQEADMKLLQSFFDKSTPTVLQLECCFNIVYYFGFRGRETLRDLTISSIGFDTDASGRRYIYIKDNSLSKNVKASLSLKEFSNLKTARMYATSEGNCPIITMEQYLEKIPPNVCGLFPMPLKKVREEDKYWYCCNKMVSHNELGRFMKKISNAANLSRIYTNHCIRSTVVCQLKESGMSNDDISSVTGHKNSESIQRYVRKRRDTDKQKISDCLSNSLSSTESMPSSSSSSEKRSKQTSENDLSIAIGSQDTCDIINISSQSSKEINCYQLVNKQNHATTERPIILNFNGTFNNCSFHNV